MNIDRIFEKGVSEMSRVPKQMLTDAEIASAAAASKSGAGIWLLSHARELLMGVGVTLTATHLTDDNPATTPSAGNAVAVVQDTTMLAEDTISTPIELFATIEESRHNTPVVEAPPGESQQRDTISDKTEKKPGQNTQYPTSHISRSTSDPDPVIVKKTITKRDTVRIDQTVIVKDTVYKIEN